MSGPQRRAGAEPAAPGAGLARLQAAAGAPCAGPGRTRRPVPGDPGAGAPRPAPGARPGGRAGSLQAQARASAPVRPGWACAPPGLGGGEGRQPPPPERLAQGQGVAAQGGFPGCRAAGPHRASASACWAAVQGSQPAAVASGAWNRNRWRTRRSPCEAHGAGHLQAVVVLVRQPVDRPPAQAPGLRQGRQGLHHRQGRGPAGSDLLTGRHQGTGGGCHAQSLSIMGLNNNPTLTFPRHLTL